MATAGELDIIVRLKSQIEKDLKPVRQSIKGLAEDIELQKRPTAMVRDLFAGLGSTLFSTTGIMVGAAGAVAGLTYFIKQSVPIAQEYGIAIGGLESMLVKFGYRAEQATESVKTLTEDGLVKPTTAAEGLRNLLVGGLGLPEAIKLMGYFTDAAAYGGSSTLSLDEKVRNLSQSFVTGYSQMAKNAGMTITWTDALELGAKALGKKVKELNRGEEALAKYTGAMIIAKTVEGDSERLAGSYTGTMIKLNHAMYMLKVTVGSLVIPILERFASWLTIITSAAIAFIARVAPGFLQMGMDMAKGAAAGGEGLEDLMKALGGLGSKASDTARKIKEAMEDFARDTKRALQDFRRNLADLVFSHKDKVAALKKQLDEERRNLEERINKMREPYEELKKNAIQAGKERLADLKAQLDKELAKGKNTNWEKVRMLEEFIAEEKIAIDKSIKEWDAKAKEEIALEVAKGEERIKEIEDELRTEQNILKRHVGIIATIKSLQREDDITRLIRQYREETKEREIQHKKNLERLKKQGTTEGSTLGKAYYEALKKWMDQMEEDTPKPSEFLTGGEDLGFVIRGILATIGDFGRKIWEALGIYERPSIAESGIGLFIKAIAEGLAALPQLAVWAGGEIVKGIVVGIQKAISSIFAIGKSIMRNIFWGVRAVGRGGLDLGIEMVKRIVSGIQGVISALATAAGNLMRRWWNTIVNWFRKAWAALVGAAGAIVAKIAGIGAGLGAWVNRLPKFERGGVVPGPVGAPVPILAHGGERIIPARGGEAGGPTININNPIFQTPFDLDLALERAALIARRGAR